MRRLRNNRGVTLVECLVSIVILGVGLVGVVGCLTAALVTNRCASDTDLATAIAQDAIEDMPSRGFGSIDYDEFPQTSPVSALHGGVQTIEITDNYLGNPRLKRVSVDLAWHSPNNSTSHVRLETAVGNRARHP
jgi:prepilin-type N-terminal cleavage/methylation domain-containing protein